MRRKSHTHYVSKFMLFLKEKLNGGSSYQAKWQWLILISASRVSATIKVFASQHGRVNVNCLPRKTYMKLLCPVPLYVEHAVTVSGLVLWTPFRYQSSNAVNRW